MMKTNLLNSSAMRLTLNLCGVFFLSVIFMFGIALYETEEDLGKGLRGSVLELQTTLMNVYSDRGLNDLKAQIDTLSIGAKGGRTLFYLTDKSGQTLAGNVIRMEIFDGWREVPAEDVSLTNPPHHLPQAFVSFGSTLEEGYLIIGRNNSEINQMRFGILESLIGGFLVSLGLTIFTGIMLARKNNRRIQAIEATLSRTATGNFASRIDVGSGSKDDLARVANSINAMLDRLETTIESLRQVSVDIAHELKTPLQRLRQKLEMLSRNDTLGGASREAIDNILEETDGIIDIFQALLRISQIEGGSRKSQFKNVNLLAICQNIIEIYEPVADDKDQNLTLVIDSGQDYNLVGDAELLTQMITNLLENAIRHCQNGAKIQLILQRKDGHLLLEISDNGPGIPEAERARVMERLYRLEKSRTTPGSGLGLSLVKAIADLHGFSVSLISNKPGLRVIVELS